MRTLLYQNFLSTKLLSECSETSTQLLIEQSVAEAAPAPGTDQAFVLVLTNGQAKPEIVYCITNPRTGSVEVLRGQEDSAAKAWPAGTRAVMAVTAAMLDQIPDDQVQSTLLFAQAQAEKAESAAATAVQAKTTATAAAEATGPYVVYETKAAAEADASREDGALVQVTFDESNGGVTTRYTDDNGALVDPYEPYRADLMRYLNGLTVEQGFGTVQLPDYAALVAFPAISGMQARVACRTSEGDEGGGVFVFDAADLSSAVAGDEATDGEGDGGLYVAPASDKTGASGAWVREVHDSTIRAPWYGLNSDTPDCSPLVYKLIRYSPLRRFYFPEATYTCNDSISVSRSMTICGDSVFKGPPRTEFVFANGSSGFVVQDPAETDSGETTNGTEFNGITITGGGGGTGDWDGILNRARTRFKNVRARDFARHGIHITAANGSGNANRWYVENCTGANNGADGLRVQGTDANTGVCINFDGSFNGGWGIYDESLLGNTYIGCHASLNDAGPYSCNYVASDTVFIGCYSEEGDWYLERSAIAIAPHVGNGGSITGPGSYFEKGAINLTGNVVSGTRDEPLPVEQDRGVFVGRTSGYGSGLWSKSGNLIMHPRQIDGRDIIFLAGAGLPETFTVLGTGGLRAPRLSTSDPNSEGVIWNDGGTLKVSSG